MSNVLTRLYLDSCEKDKEEPRTAVEALFREIDILIEDAFNYGYQAGLRAAQTHNE